MTDLPPPPAGDPPPPPPPAAAPADRVSGFGPTGVVPPRVGGPFYSVGLVILLMIVTLGIWGFFWTWRTNEDLKKYNGDGLGGWISVIIHFFVNIVLWFTIPNEVKNLYQREGRESPVSAIWGLWFLLPIVGAFVWYIKVQNALNDFWASKGANTAKA